MIDTHVYRRVNFICYYCNNICFSIFICIRINGIIILVLWTHLVACRYTKLYIVIKVRVNMCKFIESILIGFRRCYFLVGIVVVKCHSYICYTTLTNILNTIFVKVFKNQVSNNRLTRKTNGFIDT